MDATYTAIFTIWCCGYAHFFAFNHSRTPDADAFSTFRGWLSKGVSAVEHIESLNIVQTMVVFTRGC